MRKTIRHLAPVLAAILAAAIIIFLSFYFTRLQTVGTIRQITSRGGYDLYRIDVKYNYRLDDVIAYGITDDQSMVDAILKGSLPLLPVHIEVPDFGCTAFVMADTDGTVRMAAIMTSGGIPPPCWCAVRPKAATDPWVSRRWTMCPPISLSAPVEKGWPVSPRRSSVWMA